MLERDDFDRNGHIHSPARRSRLKVTLTLIGAMACILDFELALADSLPRKHPVKDAQIAELLQKMIAGQNVTTAITAAQAQGFRCTDQTEFAVYDEKYHMKRPTKVILCERFVTGFLGGTQQNLVLASDEAGILIDWKFSEHRATL